MRILVPQFYHAGYHDKASEIFQACPDTESGSSSYNKTKDTYTVIGIGVDIWENIDDFHFTYKTLHGDGSITARIDGIEDVYEWTKAGLMIRNSLDATAENVMMLVTPSGRMAFQYRNTKAGMTYSTSAPVGTVQLPYWIRLIRKGNLLVGEHSSDGVNWQRVLPGKDPNQSLSIEITMNETTYIGLAVTSHNPSRSAEATISNIRLTDNVKPSGPFTVSEDINLLSVKLLKN